MIGTVDLLTRYEACVREGEAKIYRAKLDKAWQHLVRNCDAKTWRKIK